MFKPPTTVVTLLVAGLFGMACSSSGLKSRAGDAGDASGGQVGSSSISGTTGDSGGTSPSGGAGRASVGGTSDTIGSGGAGGVNAGGAGGPIGSGGIEWGWWNCQQLRNWCSDRLSSYMRINHDVRPRRPGDRRPLPSRPGVLFLSTVLFRCNNRVHAACGCGCLGYWHRWWTGRLLWEWHTGPR